METHEPESGTIHLRLARPVQVDLGAAGQRIDAAEWLGYEVVLDLPPSPQSDRLPAIRRYETDLGLPLRAGSQQTIFRKAAFVDLGVPVPVDGGLRVPIAWRSATLAPLFPVFAGHLDISADALVLDGWYAPPGGSAGRLVDRALLNLAARGTARWFLDRIADALEAPAPRPSGTQTPR